MNSVASLLADLPQDPAVEGLDAVVQAVKAAFRDDTAPCEELDRLVAVAYEHLARTSLFCWRRVHTDTSILSARVSPPLAAIAKLDAAIIVSGAAGEGRLDLILDMIQHIQSEHTAAPNITSFVSSSVPAAPSLPAPVIPCLSAPPSLRAFQSHDHAAPFVLREYARHWPALNHRPWASTDYLRTIAGHGRVVPVEVGRDYRTDDWSQKLVAWDEFLSSLDSDDDADTLYLAQHSLLMQFPALRADIEVPDYVYSALPRPPGCEPPANDEQLVINAWLGPKGTISPAHTVRVFFPLGYQISSY